MKEIKMSERLDRKMYMITENIFNLTRKFIENGNTSKMAKVSFIVKGMREAFRMYSVWVQVMIENRKLISLKGMTIITNEFMQKNMEQIILTNIEH